MGGAIVGNDLWEAMGPNVDHWVPMLNPIMLAQPDDLPQSVYGGGRLPTDRRTLFLWRSVATETIGQAEGVLSFFLDDDRLLPLVRSPLRYGKQFVNCGISVVCEPDLSLWCDQSVEQQQANLVAQKMVSRVWQACGLRVIPVLNWSDQSSYQWCFSGTPKGAPCVITECRTASRYDTRPNFLRGLAAGIEQIQPKVCAIYGGERHRGWIEPGLPRCNTQFVFLPAWTDVRRTYLREAAILEEARYQPELPFEVVEEEREWVGEDQAQAT